MKFWNFRGRWVNVIPLKEKWNFNLELWKTNYAALMVFFNLWVRWAENYTLGTKFGSLAQRWSWAGLGGSGAATKSRGPASCGWLEVVLPGQGRNRGRRSPAAAPWCMVAVAAAAEPGGAESGGGIPARAKPAWGHPCDSWVQHGAQGSNLLCKRYLWLWKGSTVDAWVGSMHHPLSWLLLKLDDFSISFGDISIFLWIFFVPQTKVELFRLTVGIFILWKFDHNKNIVRMAIAMPMLCTPAVTKNVFTMLRWSPNSKIFLHKYLTCHTLWISRSSALYTSIKWCKRESKAADHAGQGLKKIVFFLQTL
jgi:hypothetical protein